MFKRRAVNIACFAIAIGSVTVLTSCRNVKGNNNSDMQSIKEPELTSNIYYQSNAWRYCQTHHAELLADYRSLWDDENLTGFLASSKFCVFTYTTGRKTISVYGFAFENKGLLRVHYPVAFIDEGELIIDSRIDKAVSPLYTTALPEFLVDCRSKEAKLFLLMPHKCSQSNETYSLISQVCNDGSLVPRVYLQLKSPVNWNWDLVSPSWVIQPEIIGQGYAVHLSFMIDELGHGEIKFKLNSNMRPLDVPTPEWLKSFFGVSANVGQVQNDSTGIKESEE